MRLPTAAASRRAALSSILAASSFFSSPPAFAAQGAFEMDLEFYARGLLGKPTSPPAAPQEVPKARRLDEQFVTAATDAVESSIAASLNTSPTALREAAASKRRVLALEYERVLSSGAFGDGRGYETAAGVSTQPRDATSQFDFDLSLACYYSLLADARLPRAATTESSNQLGGRLLAASKAAPPPPSTTATPPLSEILAGVRGLLTELRSTGYVAAWSLDDTDADEALWSQRSALSTTRLQVTLTESASLRAALLLNGRSGASPELAKPLLCAYLRGRGVDVLELSEYFLDSVYKASPLDYRPNQQILTLTVSPSGSSTT